MKHLLACLLVALLFSLLPFSAVAAAPLAQAADCERFTQTGGGMGSYHVCNDADARFLAAFERWGLQKIGYPISQRYRRDGFVTQAFQKAIMQWRPNEQQVVLVNIFDDLHRDGADERLLRTRQTPTQLPAGWDGGASFAEIVRRRQALLDERPALRRAYFASADPLTFFGLPTSAVEDMGNHYAIRLQRAVLQEWKETVPWARAGEVTIANGGDIAKELGGLPAAALAPVPGGTVPPVVVAPHPPAPAPQPTSAPVPSARGTILMTSNRSSYDDIYSMNADGSGLKQLTTMGQAYDARFSPDGSRIVFRHDFDVYIMAADGSGQRNLTDSRDTIEAFPVVSPDGTKIAYLFGWPGGFEIYTMNMDGSDRKPLTSRARDLEPTWAPDGSKIAFSSLRGDHANIWVVNRDGSGLRQVTQFGSDRVALSPLFSPDGSKIAFSTIAPNSAWEVWTVNLDGSDARKVVGTVGSDRNNSTGIVAWKGNRLLIAGYAGNWDPYFVDLATGELTKVPASELDDKPSDWRQ